MHPEEHTEISNFILRIGFAFQSWRTYTITIQKTDMYQQPQMALFPHLQPTNGTRATTNCLRVLLLPNHTGSSSSVRKSLEQLSTAHTLAYSINYPTIYTGILMRPEEPTR